MAKRELIDRIHLLAEIKKLQKSPWYNLGKDKMVVSRALYRLYSERKEAVEVVRDLCVNDESAITEQEIVKPYLEKLKEQIRYDYNRNIWGQYEYEKVMYCINNLLSEQEVKE